MGAPRRTGGDTMRPMKITQGESSLSEVLIYLTRTEAAELRDAAEAVLEHFDEPGYHAHVSSGDYQIEVTVAPEVDSA